MNRSLKIVFEDNHLLVINKSPGVLVQGDKTGDETLLDISREYIGKKYNKPGKVFIGLVHRLDRPASGLVILARTSKALERMTAEFRNREIRKFYWALTADMPPESQGHLVHWITKDTAKNRVRAVKKPDGTGKKAELNFRLIGHIGSEFLIEVQLITGRSHQIRSQLAAIGCPIVGDLKYGSGKRTSDGAICLHAKKVEFLHPVKKEKLILQADLPENDFWNKFSSIE